MKGWERDMKLDKIRLATTEEIEAISTESDLTPMSRVLSMGEMRAVWRTTNELDPVYYAGASKPRMYYFIWGLENILRGAGCTEYYFNVPATDKQYHEIVEHFGAVRTSKEPEFRYKITL